MSKAKELMILVEDSSRVRKLPFFSDCVSWPKQYEDALDEITRAAAFSDFSEFKNHADWEEFKNLIYVGKKIDWHVNFFKVPNWDIYYFKHSGIEYVFATPETIQEYQEFATEEE